MQKSQASIYFILFIANCFVDTINLEHCIYGSLYLVHYLNQYVCDRQNVSLFLPSSPCVRPMFLLVSSIPIKGCPPGLSYACSGNVCEDDQISNGTGPGCYCTNNAYLYQRDGTCLDSTDSQCQLGPLPTPPPPRQSVNIVS